MTCTMGLIKVVCGALFALLAFNSGHSARILGFFPYSGYSHFVIFQALMEELAEQGHDVTVLSYFPHKNPHQRYKDISLEGLQTVRMHIIDFSEFDNPPPSWLAPYYEFYKLSLLGIEDCAAILPSQQMKTIMNSKGEYDLVVMEQFNTDCFLPVVNKLQVPIIGISSCAALHWSYTRIGNPTDPAYIPNVMIAKSDHMDLGERISNMMFNFLVSNAFYYVYERPAELLIEKHLGEKVRLSELTQNTSLLFINTHFSLHRPKPHLPGVVEIGGIHIKPAKPLPKELEDFVSGAEHGVIVFSLGSMLNIKSMSKDKITPFLKVFGSLPQRIVWKIDEDLGELPKNVLTLSWLPQRDILAHGNVKAFIAHGGLLGLTEAVISGKPVVAIPMFGDQPHNVRAAVQSGVAVQLAYSEISEENIRKSIETVLSEKYQQRAQKLSQIFQDRPMSSKESAVYWVDYVLRHGGDPLRSAAADLSWIEYYMIDALAAVIFFIVVVAYLIYSLVRLILRAFKKEKKD